MKYVLMRMQFLGTSIYASFVHNGLLSLQLPSSKEHILYVPSSIFFSFIEVRTYGGLSTHLSHYPGPSKFSGRKSSGIHLCPAHSYRTWSSGNCFRASALHILPVAREAKSPLAWTAKAVSWMKEREREIERKKNYSRSRRRM